MSVKAMNQIWMSDLPRDEKYVMLCFADFGNDYGEGIYPSHEYMVWKSGYSDTQLRTIIYKLRDSKLIDVDVQGSKKGTNEYKINLENLPQRPPFRERVSKTDTQGDENRHPRVSKTDTESLVEPLVEPLVNAREKEKIEQPELTPQPVNSDNLIEGMTPEAYFDAKIGQRTIPQNSGSFTGLSADEYKARVAQALTDNLQSSNGKNVEIENYLTRVPEYVRSLAREFCYAFGRQPTKTEDKFWRKSWEDQYEIGLKSEFISKAIEKMKEDGLTYKSPASVTAIAERLMREGLTVVDPYKRYNAVYDSAGERIK